MTTLPLAFVSYSHTSDEHKNWVRDLVDALLENGVNVILDQYDLKPGHDAYAFMEQAVARKDVTHVLIVCDARYARKADHEKASGVGTESQIIGPKLYGQVDQNKFIPLVRELDEHGQPCVPTLVRGRIYVDFSRDDEFDQRLTELLRVLFDQPRHVKPVVGMRPSFSDGDDAVLSTAAAHHRLVKAVEADSRMMDTRFEEYADAFLSALQAMQRSVDELRTAGGEGRLFEVHVENIRRMVPLRDELASIVRLLSKHHVLDPLLPEVVRLLERTLRLQCRPAEVDRWNDSWWDDFVFIARELFLYCAASLLKRREYEAFSLLVKAKYFAEDERGRIEQRRYSAFDRSPLRFRSNSEDRQARLINELMPGPGLRRRDVLQADLVLFVRAVLEGLAPYQVWGPRTKYWFNRGEDFPLFARVADEAYWHGVKTVFGVGSKAEFVERVQAFARANPEWWNAVVDGRNTFSGSIDLNRLLNLESWPA